METEHKKSLVQRMKEEDKTWKAIVVNSESGDKIGFSVTTPFCSEDFETQEDCMESILHKVCLDLMTNLHYGFKKPVQIYISEI